MSSTHDITASYSSEYLEEYNGDALRAIAVLFIVLVPICVILRFFARRVGSVAWGLDDTMTIPGTIFCLALCTCALVEMSVVSLGYHVEVIMASEPQKVANRAKFILASPLIYLGAVLFSKLAILAMYLRIFTTRPYRITCWVLAAVLVANWFAFTVAIFCVCTPLEYLWDRTIAGGHCIDIALLYRLSAIPNITTDVVMLVLPLPVVWKLHTSREVKVGLTMTFATGSIGLLTSVLRCAQFAYHSPTRDVTYSAVYIYIYVICECCMYLIAACLPTYRPLVLLFRANGPLSISRFRSDVATGQSSHASSRTTGIPLHALGNSKFQRLDEGKSEHVESYRGRIEV